VTVEDLGGGLKGGFDSQIRFNAASGDVGSFGNGNALFHSANAYVGGSFGTVRVGKIAEATLCAFDPWGCTGGASTVAGQSGTIGAAGSGLVGALAVQNAVSYATPSIAGFSASYLTSVSTLANERQVLSLNYANGPFAAQVLRTDGNTNGMNNGANGAPATVPTDSKGEATGVAASYDFGVAKLNVTNSVTKSSAGAKTWDITTVGASVPMGAITVLAGYTQAKKIGTTTGANDTKIALGANYALSKRTTLGADVFEQEQVGGSTGFVLRARHTF